MQDGFSELISTLKENTGAMSSLRENVGDMRTELKIHNTEQRRFEELVRKHEVQLNGDDKSLGLVAAVSALNKSMSNIERAVWVVVGVILTGFAVALLGIL